MSNEFTINTEEGGRVVRRVAISAEQALDIVAALKSGKPATIAYVPTNDVSLVDDDGVIWERERTTPAGDHND